MSIRRSSMPMALAIILLLAIILSGCGSMTSHWAQVTIAGIDSGELGSLYGVSCAKTNDCWAVGQASSGSVVVHFDGQQWSAKPSPQPNDSNSTAELRGVSCVSPKNCWAAGGYFTPEYTSHSLLEHFDGSKWSIVTTPGSDNGNSLNSLACTSSGDCWAVGDGLAIEHFQDSRWQTINSGSLDDASSNLFGVTCLTSNDCWAVGNGHRGQGDFTATELIKHYDGSSWRDTRIPITTNTSSILRGISCATSVDCWAIGEGEGSVAHFDGNSWTDFPIPTDAVNQLPIFDGISCTSTSDCWAVGAADSNTAGFGDDRKIAEHYDGKQWSIGFGRAEDQTALSGITCLPKSGCWAVGGGIRGIIRYNNLEIDAYRQQ